MKCLFHHVRLFITLLCSAVWDKYSLLRALELHHLYVQHNIWSQRVKVINPTLLKKKRKRNSNSHAENQSLKHKLSAGRDKKWDPPEEARWRDRLLRGFPWSCLSPGRASLCSGAAWVSPLSLSLMGATMGQGDEITLWAAEQQVRGSTGHD